MNQPLITNVERDPRAPKSLPGKPRKHSKKQIADLARNMARVGTTNPALIDEGDTILAVMRALWPLSSSISGRIPVAASRVLLQPKRSWS